MNAHARRLHRGPSLLHALVCSLPALAALALPLVASAEAGALRVTWKQAVSSPHPAAKAGPREAALLGLCGPADSALMEVAGLVARRQLDGASALTADELAFALRAAGDPHVWPKAWSLSGVNLDDADSETRFKGWIGGLRSLGARRCGVAKLDGEAGASVATVITFDALADMAPVATTARVGQWITLEGTMLVPASGVQVVLLGPRAAPRTVPSSLSGGKIRSTFAVDQPGAWLVQVLATVSTGPRPVLETTIYAGQKPPSEFVRAAVPGEEAAAGAKDDADAMLRMINAARIAEGRKPLVRDAALDKVARAHSEEMMKARLVGHDVGGGDPRKRIEAAGIQAAIAGENVASASSLPNAHRALWASPSHRGNLLLERFSRVGVAVSRGTDGSYWVTELFSGS
ncbi:CAP domain-containing protein [Polyangium mundeleinium]|uniref:CAP domain-containing protein n=1 Tax=Polyangium mundeleinium TaxID=2995306 RepID=A0ABT5F7T6_9BACT|nr:CAP domain-containing protein [Polyangium mundeleinium]MDC0749170.1 CAP domain-containing protein [Polyangium mundeleinium]